MHAPSNGAPSVVVYPREVAREAAQELIKSGG